MLFSLPSLVFLLTLLCLQLFCFKLLVIYFKANWSITYSVEFKETKVLYKDMNNIVKEQK